MADLIPIIVPMEVAVSEMEIPVEIELAYYTSEYEEYTGETEFTPSRETQVIATANRVVKRNITINPIPSNYGLISWDGSVLTVS